MIESSISKGRNWDKNISKNNEVNIGFQLDPNYIFRAMITLSSIIDSQNSDTKIRFHFAVVLSFTVSDMLKIYTLREKIRDDVEFNFYNAKRVEVELKDLNIKGPGAVAKLLLPELIPHDIEKLIIFDTGDLLVLRDLKEMYNWKMNEYLYLGIPDSHMGKYAKNQKKIMNTYINVGSFLVNVKMVKLFHMYEKFVKNKDLYHSKVGDQDLLNDIAYDKIGYLPMKFGIRGPYENDNDSDLGIKSIFNFINRNKNKNFSFIPQNETELFKIGYNPVVVHQCNGKWMEGKGMTVYRRLAQYYIKMADIWEEICQSYPGYCKK